MSNYWQRLTAQRRITRRSVLAASTGLGVGALALTLAGCGGGGNGGGSATPQDKSGLLYTPRDSTGQAKAGGVLRHYSTADITHFDAVADSSALTVGLSSEPFYPRLLRLKAFKFPEQPDGSSLGEAAESWEVSPDKLQITFKVRQGMKWDSRAPTSSRPLDSQDIVFSWNKFKALNTGGGALGYDATRAPNSPVESLTAPDNKTIVVKLHTPNASIIPMFSARDLLYIAPLESDGGFDPRKEVRGHGPWLLDEYVPSARFVYARNPDYYVKDRPFPDKVEVPIVTEQATRLAQFKAGNIFTDVVQNSQANVVITKRDVPDTLLIQQGNYPETSSMMIVFGWETGVPWRDVRARQALSMMIDREAYIDVIDNRESFRKDGLELPVRRNSVIPGGWGDYWLDPTDAKGFGPSAKYLDINLDEAKKLWSAAGLPNGFEFELNFAGQGQYGAAYTKAAELYSGMFINGGLKPKLTPIVPSDHWLTDFSRVYTKAAGGGNRPGFTGVAQVAERTYTTAAVQVFNQFNPGGQGFRGMIPAGGSGSPLDGDPKCTDLANKISQEYDRNKQISLVHELIRYATEQTYYIPRASAAKAFTIWWPALGNAGAWVSYPGAGNWADLRINWWIDAGKPPLGRT